MRRRAVSVGVVLLGLGGVVGCDDDGTSEPAPTPSPTPSPTTPAPDDDALTLRYGLVRERSVDGGADGRNTTAAVAGINEFAVDLYRQVLSTEGGDGNVVVSPYSVVSAMSMIYAGARGVTADEMAAALHADQVDQASWHEGINAYDLTLDARTAGSPTEWSSANKVWTVPGLALRDDYLDVLTGAYGSPLAELDFAADPDAASADVNEWVERNTEGLIPELFPPGSFSPQTVLVLVNAIAMDAPWEFPFDPVMTADAPFTKADGSVVQVPTMRYDEYLPSASLDGVHAVELPYGGGALSMVVIVPTDLAAFEAALTNESLQTVLGAIQDGGIHLSIPKWSARTHLTLNETLQALGIVSAFGAGADFSGMVDGGGLWLDQVEHEAFVEVDEQGTRAAAATGGEMAASHGPTIAVDRPFLYVIRDQGAGTILFIGRVADPTIAP